ncbi:MAG: ATP-binding cassette domain-containing protein, partial [Christensenellaceae bacterium]
ILLRLGIEGKKNVYPHTLSGGEAQRVSFARAFLYPSQLLLMDEPFSSLDLSRKIGLIEAFASLWQREKRTVIFVTHDPEEVSMLSERAICLRGGKITADVRREGKIPAPYGSDSDYRRKILDCILHR